jgi:hypothetical protein
LVPALCFVPAFGLLEITSPFATVPDAFFVTVPAEQLAFFSAVLAAARALPTTFGTMQAFFGGVVVPCFPLLTVSATFVPARRRTATEPGSP